MFVGEPEDGILQLAALDSLARLGEVANLTWRDAAGAVVAHRAHGSFSGLHEDARIPRGICCRSVGYALPLVDKPYVIVETSRGCPYSCDFCVAPIHQGHKFRERSAKELVDEIERSHRELGVEFFYLWGDTVTLNVKSFTAFCDELIARKLPIKWFGNARADNLTDPAFVHQLKRAGCWMLALGIETESDDVRKDMVKRLERQKIQAAFSNMRDAGIRSFAFFIFGYPGETLEDDGPDDRIRHRARPRLRQLLSGRALPGHGAVRQGVREGLLPADARQDWSKMEYSYYLLRGNGLDERVVMDAINRAKRRFFLRPAYLARHVGDVARLALTKQNILWQVAARTMFGGTVVDATVGADTRRSAAGSQPSDALALDGGRARSPRSVACCLHLIARDPAIPLVAASD